MSESLTSAVKKLDFRKYVDEIESEVSKILVEFGPAKTEDQKETARKRLQDLVRTQSNRLSHELGLGGNYAVAFMLSSALIMGGWAAFAITKDSLDERRPFEERVSLVELGNGLSNVVAEVMATAVNYAELYPKESNQQQDTQKALS